MDEPLSQLDGARRAEILPFLERLAHEAGVPILYVSHAVDEVARLADQMVVLSEGKVIASGPIEDGVRPHRPRRSHRAPRGRRGAQRRGRRPRAGFRADAAQPRRRRPGRAVARPQTRSKRCASASAHATWRLRCRAPTDLSIRNIIAAEVMAVEFEEGAFAEMLLSRQGSICGPASRESRPSSLAWRRGGASSP